MTKDTVPTSDGESHVEGLTTLDASPPFGQDMWQYLWIVHALPAPPFHLRRISAGVFIPAVIVPEDPAVWFGHPGQLGNGISQLPEESFTSLQPILEFTLVVDIRG